jgi:hypothetical protein
MRVSATLNVSGQGTRSPEVFTRLGADVDARGAPAEDSQDCISAMIVDHDPDLPVRRTSRIEITSGAADRRVREAALRSRQIGSR